MIQKIFRHGRRFLNPLIFITAILVCAGSVRAEEVIEVEKPYTDKISEKLGRGAVNIAFSGVEISRSVEQELDNDQIQAAVTTGVLKGSFRMLKRICVGVFEVATFYVPSKPLLQPEYVIPRKDIQQ